MITEKLSKDDISYYKNGDLLDMNKYNYGMDEQKIFEQHLQQQIAAGSNWSRIIQNSLIKQSYDPFLLMLVWLLNTWYMLLMQNCSKWRTNRAHYPHQLYQACNQLIQ